MKHWIQTASGLSFDLENPDSRAVCITDIAHALAQICRFTGHTRFPYSVAQHSVTVSEQLEHHGHPPHTVLVGLLHDAHEAYMGDIAIPVAEVIAPDVINALKRRIDQAIFGALEIYPTEHEERLVAEVDRRMLATERAHLMGIYGQHWPALTGVAMYHDVTVGELTAHAARELFLAAYDRLIRRLGQSVGV